MFTQKQPSGGVLKKRCSENMHQIYWRTHMPNCDFNKVASVSSINLECKYVTEAYSEPYQISKTERFAKLINC